MRFSEYIKDKILICLLHTLVYDIADGVLLYYRV